MQTLYPLLPAPACPHANPCELYAPLSKPCTPGATPCAHPLQALVQFSPELVPALPCHPADERFPFEASVEFIFSSGPEKIKGEGLGVGAGAWGKGWGAPMLSPGSWEGWAPPGAQAVTVLT